MAALAGADVASLSLICTGMLPPSFVEYALRGGAAGVLVTGCREGGCEFRLGAALDASSACSASASRTCAPRCRASASSVAWADAGDEPRRRRGAGRAAPPRRAACAAPRDRACSMDKPTSRTTPLAWAGQAAAVRRCSRSSSACFSRWPAYRHLAADQALIKLSFTHAGKRVAECRQLSAEELAKLPPNMRAPMKCARERAPVRVEVDIDGAPAFRHVAAPSGLSKDGASAVYQRLARARPASTASPCA